MELGDIYREFLILEDELKLFKATIDGVAFWERIRTNVFLRMFEMIVGSESSPPPDLGRKKLRRLITSIFKPRRNPFISSRKDILFVGSPRRMLQSDGYWWDIYTDPIIEKMSSSYASLENQYLQKHATPAKTSNLKYMDFLDLIAYIKQKSPFGSFSITSEERSLLRLIKDEIEQRFNVQMNIESIILGALKRRKAALPLYTRVLRRVKPKVVVMVVSYGKEDLVEACRILGIPTIELQHGVISQYHPGYSYPGDERTKNFFPDYLFAFGDYWLTAADYPLEKDRILCVGYPYLENEMGKYRDLEKKKQVVIISQERLGQQLSEFAVELSKRNEFDYRIVYKLHPREVSRWKELYPWLCDADVEVVDDPGISLYKLFGESSIQIGVFSTAIYEGLSFGLRTFLVDLPGVEYFDQLVEKNIVTKVTSVEDFLEQLKSLSDSQLFENEHFFKSNAVEGIIRELDRIVNSDSCES